MARKGLWLAIVTIVALGGGVYSYARAMFADSAVQVTQIWTGYIALMMGLVAITVAMMYYDQGRSAAQQPAPQEPGENRYGDFRLPPLPDK